MNFYSRKDWVVKDAQSLEDLTLEVPELQGVLDADSLEAPSFDFESVEYSDGPLPL